MLQLPIYSWKKQTFSRTSLNRHCNLCDVIKDTQRFTQIEIDATNDKKQKAGKPTFNFGSAKLCSLLQLSERIREHFSSDRLKGGMASVRNHYELEVTYWSIK